MSYHPLANDTGGDGFARNREAHKIIVELDLASHCDEMTHGERQFVTQCAERLDDYDVKAQFSPKQIFWLRDLVDKYL